MYILISLFRGGDPVCGLQGHNWLLRCETWLLESRAQSFKATYLAGKSGSVVGHHGTTAQAPWYRYHTQLYTNMMTCYYTF